MSKKFFDIIPPKENKPSDQRINLQRKIIEEKNIKTGANIEPTSLNWAWARTLFLSLTFLFLLGTALFFIFSGAKIEIWPNMKMSVFKADIVLGLKADKADFGKRMIPAKIFKDQKMAAKKIVSSGKVLEEKKAQGTIRIFNNYSSSAQGLLAHTRFVSKEGKLFRSQKRETIPGKHYENGKWTLGFKDIAVTAAGVGEDYNIGPSTFSIPGFKGSSKYTYFYGKSYSPMTGGFEGQVSQVTDNDIEKARLDLLNKLKKDSKDSLTKMIPSDYSLIGQTVWQETKDSGSSAKAGSKSSSFISRAKLESQGIAVKKKDINELIQKIIASNISEDENYQKKSLKVKYSLKSPLPQDSEQADSLLKSGKIVLALSIQVKTYQDLDLSVVRKAIIGRSSKEVKIFLSNSPAVKKIEIKAWPLFRKKLPDNLKNIQFKLNLD